MTISCKFLFFFFWIYLELALNRGKNSDFRPIMAKGCQDISPRRHFTAGHLTTVNFIPMTFYPHWHFTSRIFHPTDISPLGHFTPQTFYPTDISTQGHFTPIWKVVLISTHINMHGEQLDTIDNTINIIWFK